MEFELNSDTKNIQIKLYFKLYHFNSSLNFSFKRKKTNIKNEFKINANGIYFKFEIYFSF